MANYGTTTQQRTSPTRSSSPPPREAMAEDDSFTGKTRFFDSERIEIRLMVPLRLPTSPEVASLRIVNNLTNLAIYYAHFVWIILLITLIPCRKVSLVVLVIVTYVGSLYSLLLRAFPASYLLHKVIDPRAVVGLIAVGAAVGLLVTDAGLHLVLTLAGAIPLVLVHAVLWVTGVQEANDEISGSPEPEEALPLVSPTANV